MDNAINSFCDDNDGSIVFSGFDEEKKKAVLSPVMDEPDPGPSTAWSWCYQDYNRAELWFSMDWKPLRAKGYVTWDYARLVNEWDFFSKTYSEIFRAAHAEASSIPTTLSMEEIEHSYMRRTDIWELGGRGWWSTDDESKITWPKKP